MAAGAVRGGHVLLWHNGGTGGFRAFASLRWARSLQLAFSHDDLLGSGDPTVHNLRQF
jgi:hypothetical protein